MESRRSEDQDVHREPLDVAFRLRRDQLASEHGAFAPAERAGEVLELVASALREIPFGDLHGITIRRITDLTVESEASLEAPVEARACAVDCRELTAGRHLVVLDCSLTSESGERVAAFSVETEATAAVPVVSTGAGSTGRKVSVPASEPVECVDDIPV